MKINIQKLHPDATIPRYATDGAACFDIHAILDAPVTLYRGESVIIRTGLAFEVPDGYALMVYGRSGQAFKHGIRLANSVGVVDSDYRGEVMVKLTREYETATNPITIETGDRIAQAMVIPSPRVEFEVSEQLTLTDRGQAGLGSTGK